MTGSSLGTRVLLTTGCTAAPSASRSRQRAAMALSSSVASAQAKPSAITRPLPISRLARPKLRPFSSFLAWPTSACLRASGLFSR